jgi:hypothetical protein
MTDPYWGSPEIRGLCDALAPEFQITQSGGMTGPLPTVGQVYWCRVDTTTIGRYRAVAWDDDVTGGGFKTSNPVPGPVPTIIFGYVNLDGVDNGPFFEGLAFPHVGTGDWQRSADYALGALDVFASIDELKRALPLSGVYNERHGALALLAASRHVLHALGYAIDVDAEVPPDPASIDVVPVACRSSWRIATLVAAVRFYKGMEVPFGVAGGWDMATYVRMSIPDVDLALLGERVRFGVA